MINISYKKQMINSNREFENLTIDEARRNRIINVITRKTGITFSQMKDSTRKGHVVAARQTAMVFIYLDLGMTYNKIGELFGGRDHSTVIHALKSIRNDYQTNKQVRNNLDQILEEIDPGLKPEFDKYINEVKEKKI